ncbi:hypothetical protein SynBIOSU31_02216 [Synechococcus sp. BIOS-U3-1]|uniref:hypothetical protein n=1 Tax=Synechococcus sp. BIOS-U3-1 TaxID=1400865 RepID=UPI0018624FB6|nr:hypothetical protein [Synechococcus sp. BIOS-U3-1]QNI59082.1 hypothetical protein SynBIOSU31_02216 [Synechococcus sp. BIOS-U3-1]|tara:strand:- start:431 stop:673 length:243 start_codon:yes stop_codon:yes gene_type:complete
MCRAQAKADFRLLTPRSVDDGQFRLDFCIKVSSSCSLPQIAGWCADLTAMNASFVEQSVIDAGRDKELFGSLAASLDILA